jgi:hypothetical protein
VARNRRAKQRTMQGLAIMTDDPVELDKHRGMEAQNLPRFAVAFRKCRQTRRRYDSGRTNSSAFSSPHRP